MSHHPHIPKLTAYYGTREAPRFLDDPPYRMIERAPELDVFLIDDEYVTREAFEAKLRELRMAP